MQRFDVGDGVRRLYRIRIRTLPHLTGFVYLLLGDFPPTLIDAGSGEGESSIQLLEGLDQVRTRFRERLAPQDIDRIFLTHAHVDHFGGAGALAAYLDAEIWMHVFDSRIVMAHDERADVSNRAFELFLGQCGVESQESASIARAFGFTRGRTRSAPVARFLRDGELVDEIEIFHTPGHSPGHLCFRIGPYLLLGDLILSQTVTQIWPQTLLPGTGLEVHLRSLDRMEKVVRGIQLTYVKPIGLAGHEAVIDNLALRIAHLRKNHERRSQRVLDIIIAAPAPPSILEIARKMYAESPLSRSLMAIADVAARLEYLQQYGRIAVANHAELERMAVPVCRYVTV